MEHGSKCTTSDFKLQNICSNCSLHIFIITVILTRPYLGLDISKLLLIVTVNESFERDANISNLPQLSESITLNFCLIPRDKRFCER